MSLEGMTEQQLLKKKSEWWTTAVSTGKIKMIHRVCARYGTQDSVQGGSLYQINEYLLLGINQRKNQVLATYNGQIVCDQLDKLFVPGKWFDVVEIAYEGLDKEANKRDANIGKQIDQISERNRENLLRKLTLKLPSKK